MKRTAFFPLFLCWLALCPSLYGDAPTEIPAEQMDADQLFDMSLEQLMEVRIDSVATITTTSPRLVPSAVTTITEEQIQASGARHLFELLDIYVPNLQWIRNHWEVDNLGLRGIMSDKEDKYLLLVNGRVMNERVHIGAITERDLTNLRDIHHIDIIRGPGSAMYGPGAVAMVINIITHNAETFQGTEITTRAGAVEEFYSTEIRHGRKFEDGDGGLFLYGGITKYLGADQYDAPYVIGKDLPSESDYSWWDLAWGPPYTGPEYLPGDGTRAGDPVYNPDTPRDFEDHRNLPQLKLYAEFNRDDWDIWARYTRGGKQLVQESKAYIRADTGYLDYLYDQEPFGSMGINSYGYQQLTFFVGREQELSEQTRLDYSFSYDLLDYERVIQSNIADAFRQDRYMGKVMLRHDFNEKHRVATGFEVSHHEMGYPSLGWPRRDDAVLDKLSNDRRWSTNLYSWVGEYQWTISDKWTAFLGARLDDHTYTEEMFSPRVAVVHTPTPKDTFKYLWSRSVRSNFEEEMRAQRLAGNTSPSQPEKLDSFEIRYERSHSRNLTLASSVFWYYNLELLSWSPSQAASVPVGTQKHWGFELEADYHTDTTRFGISHSYAKLCDFELAPGQSTLITALPYGYGDDLALWSNHITKVYASQKLNDQWTLDGSMRIYWQFPGMEDYTRYLYDQAPANYKPTNEDWDDAFDGNYYLNLGLQYQPNDDLTFRVDGYNLLGIFDKDLNKRNYVSDFRSHAPAVAFTVSYKF